MGLTGKRMVILIVFVLMVMTGLGTTLMAQRAASAAPDMTGLVWASSPLDVPVAGVQPQPAICPPDTTANQAQIDLYTWQLEEAWRQGDWNRCIDVLTIVLTIDPANSAMCERLYQARVNYGWLLLSRQQFDDAYKQFTIALQLRPSGPEASEGLRLLQQLVVPAISAPPATPLSPPPAALVCPTGTARVYVVQRGDNLFRIALRFNTSAALIMKANGMQTTSLKAGQRLVIP